MIIGGWRGPGWRLFDGGPDHAREVRGWIRSAITGHGCPVDPDDVELAADELYVNATVHGPKGGGVLVGYCLWSGGARILACDGGGETTPKLRPASYQSADGRGLQIIDALAARWGHFRLDGCQVVWCDFAQPLHAAPSDAWAWLRFVLPACRLSAPDRTLTAAAPGMLAAAGAV